MESGMGALHGVLRELEERIFCKFSSKGEIQRTTIGPSC